MYVNSVNAILMQDKKKLFFQLAIFFLLSDERKNNVPRFGY